MTERRWTPILGLCSPTTAPAHLTRSRRTEATHHLLSGERSGCKANAIPTRFPTSADWPSRRPAPIRAPRPDRPRCRWMPTGRANRSRSSSTSRAWTRRRSTSMLGATSLPCGPSAVPPPWTRESRCRSSNTGPGCSFEQPVPEGPAAADRHRQQGRGTHQRREHHSKRLPPNNMVLGEGCDQARTDHRAFRKADARSNSLVRLVANSVYPYQRLRREGE